MFVPQPIICDICSLVFPSKNALFKHLKDHGYVNQKLEKVILLIGWMANDDIDTSDVWNKDYNINHTWTEVNDSIEEALVSAISAVDDSSVVISDVENLSRPKGFSRASSCAQRATFLLSKEKSCSGVCDVICLPLKACLDTDKWVLSVNESLPSSIRLLARLSLPKGGGDFHAESFRVRGSVINPAAIWEQYDQQSRAKQNSGGNFSALIVAAASEVNSPFSTERDAWCEMDRCFPRDSQAAQDRIDFFRRLKVMLKKFGGRHSLHNFVAGGASPDDAVVRRRIDRFFHLQLTRDSPTGDIWVVFSVSGDTFLRGQARHMMGLVLAYSRGWLPPAYLDACLSDEVMLVPSAPAAALLLAEAKFDKWEAKFGVRLGARETVIGCEADPLTVRVAQWRDQVLRHVMTSSAPSWVSWEAETQRRCEGFLRDWLVLQSLRARTLDAIGVTSLTSPEWSEQPAIVSAYRETLMLLRQADKSGFWPPSSTNRQRVIATPDDADTQSGSFSVGVYPPPLPPPRGNELFPDLVRSCFRLEKVLCPHRPPSTTIAINRNAQFRPHRDSGAGSGQSSSLIVALGEYSGGELVVEGAVHDIRYRPLQFDGWGERHWTLPFQGERYSLVWFTPKGAEACPHWWDDPLPAS